MKADQLVTILAGAILAYVAYKTFAKTGSTSAGSPATRTNTVGGMYSREIANSALPGQPGYNWNYYRDDAGNHVEIAPNGDYYLNGNKVWTAP